MITDPVLAIAVPFVAEQEGFESAPYQDVAGIWTEGDGFVYLPDGSRITPTTPPMSRETATLLLTQLLGSKFIPAVRTMVLPVVSNHFIAALASFAYNEGLNALKNSTLLRDLNLGNMAAAEAQFLVWDVADGRVIGGLLRRRKAEVALALMSDSAGTPSPALTVTVTAVPAGSPASQEKSP